MFRVHFDPIATRVRISVAGFLKPEDVPALASAIGAKAREARASSHSFDVIVESLEFPVQANGVADTLSEIMRAGMALTSGRAAIVVGSQLNRQQAERTLGHPRLRVFMSIDAAENWLARKEPAAKER